MGKSGALGYFCTIDGAALNYQGDSEALMHRFLQALAKALTKKGVEIVPVASPEQATMQFRVDQIEQGNQLLRYLLPFLAPAFIEIDVDIATPDGPETLHYRQAAQVGLFGGSAKGMLSVCADRIAKRIAKDLLKRFG